jgi:hypothetical protein
VVQGGKLGLGVIPPLLDNPIIEPMQYKGEGTS